MEERLVNYIDTLFADAPNTKRALELKDEMTQNLLDKYRDLIAEGKSDEAAYNIATMSIGDVSELISQLKNGGKVSLEARRKSAILVSVAIVLYILSVIPVILLGAAGNGVLGVILMFVLVAIATGMLIYNSMTKPSYIKNDDTVVEDFKEWKSEKHEKNSTKSVLSSALWACTLVVYLAVSFTTRAWGVTWIVFLISGAIQRVIYAAMSIKKTTKDVDEDE